MHGANDAELLAILRHARDHLQLLARATGSADYVARRRHNAAPEQIRESVHHHEGRLHPRGKHGVVPLLFKIRELSQVGAVLDLLIARLPRSATPASASARDRAEQRRDNQGALPADAEGPRLRTDERLAEEDDAELKAQSRARRERSLGCRGRCAASDAARPAREHAAAMTPTLSTAGVHAYPCACVSVVSRRTRHCSLLTCGTPPFPARKRSSSRPSARS